MKKILVLDQPICHRLCNGMLPEIADAAARGAATLLVPALFLGRMSPLHVAVLLRHVQVVPSTREDIDALLHGGPCAVAVRAGQRWHADAVVSDADSVAAGAPATVAGSAAAPPLVVPERALTTHGGALDFCDLHRQQADLAQALTARIERVLMHGRYIMGPEIAELETRLRTLTGARHAIALSNGTTALELALRALDIGPGDEVITTPFTWIASAEVIPLVGAHPVFADIDPATFLIDPAAIARALTPRTRAIIAVGLFGQMPDLDAIAAAAPGIPIIEDAAQSLGATHLSTPAILPRSGADHAGTPHTAAAHPGAAHARLANVRRSGAASLIGTTSFFPSKPLGCYGDGGAAFTDDDAIAARLRALRTHGGERRHEHHLIGTNARLDTLQAAILLAKFDRFPADIAGRQRAAATYDRLLAGLPGCITPTTAPGNTHVYAQYTLRLPATATHPASTRRDALAAALQKAGIPTALYYPACIHTQPCFAPFSPAADSPAAGAPAEGYRFPHAETAAAEVLSLPMHSDLRPDELSRIAEEVRKAVGELA